MDKQNKINSHTGCEHVESEGFDWIPNNTHQITSGCGLSRLADPYLLLEIPVIVTHGPQLYCIHTATLMMRAGEHFF